MDNELTRGERWEWLRKTCWGKSHIPWDRMALPSHEWLDEVKTFDSIDSYLTIHKGEVIKVPRYRDELTGEMRIWLDTYNEYKK